MEFEYDDSETAKDLVERTKAFMDEVVTLVSARTSWAAVR